jgi:hypothetical protein
MAAAQREEKAAEKPPDKKGPAAQSRAQGPGKVAAARDPGRSLSDPSEGLDQSALARLQRTHGNQHVQRVLAAADQAPLLPRGPGGARKGGGGTDPPAGPDVPGAAGGRPLDPQVRSDMESRLGTPLPAVRVHTDGAAAKAAQGLGARAFTTGQDIYFAAGAYDPESARGRALLAHELVHALQQRGGPAAAPEALTVSSPDDPMERQAERIADQVGRGGHARPESWTAPGPLGRARIHRQAADAALPPGPTAEGDFVVGLGGGLKIKKEDLAGARAKGRYEKDLSAMSLPGLKVKRLVLKLDRESGQVQKGDVGAALEVPFLKLIGGATARFDIDAQGRTSFRAKGRMAVPGLSEPELDLGLAEGAVTAKATLTPEKLRVPGVPKLKIPSASVVLGVEKGQLTGTGAVTLEYPGLARGTVDVAFKGGTPAGKGRVELLPDYLKGVEAGLEIVEGNLQGDVTIPASKLSPPVPGLTISEGAVKLGMKNGQLSGSGEGIKFAYRSLGEGSLDFSIRKDRIDGKGGLAVNIPGLSPVKGELRYRDGALSGKATITADKFPKGLPVKSGSITVLVDERGGIGAKGAVLVDLLGVGSGELKLGYEKGVLDLGAEVILRKVPGLEEGRVAIHMKEGVLEGEGQIAVAPKQIPGLTGNILVIYKDSLFSGKGKIGYAKDKFAGEVELFVDQDEKGKLALSGNGEVTARLTDWLTGRVRVEVYKDATTKVAGTLKADDIELFPAKKADKELFSYSQNIPLWAILVAVIRMRAGVRAGVGPGKLRGVTAEGEFSTAEGDQPSFSITGELYIPAYAEAYVAFGAGLGLDVVIGSLTGGIEAVGTAGIYGAVSIIPELSYEGGNWSISGVATLAAGAKLKLGLQAWAEVEAFWITVWENTWHLAEWVWDVGPELGLQASVNYVFGKPEPPTFDFKTSDIDTSKLVQDAMPEDGPKGSGAREALKNTASWKGKLKEERKDPSKIPSELADKNAKAPVPKAPPAKPSRKTPPPGAAKDPAKAKADAEKDAPTKGAPAPGKTPDKTHDEKAANGFAALDKLHDKALRDPEDPGEIKSHLAALKAEHGFTTLSHRLEGEEWVIDAGMSPSKKVKVKAGPLKPPPTMITYGAADARRGGRRMVADPLTKDHPAGSTVSDAGASPIWAEVNQRRNDRRLYVLGHLLNNNLGGPGDEPRNLTPITFSANATHLNRVEKDIKRIVNTEGGMVHYEVDVNYPGSPNPVPDYFKPPKGSPAEGELAETLTARWWRLVRNPDDPAQLKKDGDTNEIEPITNVPPFPQT